MENEDRRLCERKAFDQSLCFEMSITEAMGRNVKQTAAGVDVSSFGLGMKSGQSMKKGSVVKFYFPMREIEITVPVYAQVVWSKPDNDHFRIGLRFLD